MYDPYRHQRQQGQGPEQPQLFEDTSGDAAYSYPNQDTYSYGPSNVYGAAPPNYQSSNSFGLSSNVPGSQFMQDPFVRNVAMQYGQNLVDQGKQYVDTKLEKMVAVSKLKYYFAVDTKYVLKKLKLLFFPFTHSDWSIQYNNESDEPLQPRYDLNAPDLYIPAMAFVTYILLAGLCLGLRDAFSPDALGIEASWAVVWLAIELGVILVSFHVLSVKTKLQTLHLLALSSYKYAGMIFCLAAGILFDSFGYYCILGYTGLAALIFIFRTYRFQIQDSSESAHGYSAGTKRRFYLLLLISALQPFMMWLLTSHLVSTNSARTTLSQFGNKSL